MLQGADTTRPQVKERNKCQAKNFGHMMRREKLEHLVTIGMVEGKRRKNVGWTNKVADVGQVTDLLKATRDRDAWKFTIA